jgi:hypothetical protein
MVMKYKNAKVPAEIEALSDEQKAYYAARPYLTINQWGLPT